MPVAGLGPGSISGDILSCLLERSHSCKWLQRSSMQFLSELTPCLTEAYGRHAALAQVCAKKEASGEPRLAVTSRVQYPEGPSIFVINCGKFSGIQPQAVLTKVLHGKSKQSAKRVIIDDIIICNLKWKPRACVCQALTKRTHKIT